MTDYVEWQGNPRPVSVLEYIDTLLRAVDTAGLTVCKAHVSTIRQMIERDYGNDAVKPENVVRPVGTGLDQVR
jgi:hypothetical protein